MGSVDLANRNGPEARLCEQPLSMQISPEIKTRRRQWRDQSLGGCKKRTVAEEVVSKTISPPTRQTPRHLAKDGNWTGTTLIT
jgi:hypothetical protein